MLTKVTAKELGVKNRVDAIQSINGGALYFTKLKNRIHSQINEPDRTWFALAAYNIGLGHVEDARKLTKDQEGNPNNWIDVKQRLPLLQKRKYYKTTKYGYARGTEAVDYVQNIRRYYDVLYHVEQNKNKIAMSDFNFEFPINPSLDKEETVF